MLIFTEYRKTQDGLAEALAKDFKIKYSAKYEDQPGQVIATIHGSCPDVHLMKTVEAFGTGSSPMRMLIATDVASEGLNLHHECHNIIHYDLPWSIITLIQRNGRIDRFGQTIPPVLRYLRVSTKQGMLTGDKEIFDRLIDKVEEINRSTSAGRERAEAVRSRGRGTVHRRSRHPARATSNVLEKAAMPPADEADDLENMLNQANIKDDEDFLRILLGESPTLRRPSLPQARPPMASPSGSGCTPTNSSCLEGYRYLAEQQPRLPADRANRAS